MHSPTPTLNPLPTLGLKLLDPSPSATIDGKTIPLKDKRGKYVDLEYWVLVCYLAARGREASLNSIPREVYDVVDPAAADQKARSVRSTARARVPEVLWAAMGRSVRPEDYTYIVFSKKKAGDVTVSLAEEVSCDLIQFLTDVRAAFHAPDPVRCRALLAEHPLEIQAGAFLEGAEAVKEWNGRWLQKARDEIKELFRRLNRLAVGGQAADLPPGQPREASELAKVYEALPEEAHGALKALAVCPGACSIEALQAIADRKDLSPDLLNDLERRGLVGIEDTGESHEDLRYSIVADLGRWLTDERSPHPLDRYRERRRDHFLKVVEKCAKGLAAPDSPKYREELIREYANIRSCIDWSLERAYPETLVYCYCLQNFWIGQSNMEASYRYCTRIIGQAPKEPSEALARSHKCAMVLALYRGLYEAAERHFEDCVATWKKAGGNGKVTAAEREEGILKARNDLAVIKMEVAKPDSDDYKSAGNTLTDILTYWKKASVKAKDKLEVSLGKVRENAAPERVEIRKALRKEAQAASEKLKVCRVSEADSLYNLAIFDYYRDESLGGGHESARTYLRKCSRICELPDVDYTEGLARCHLAYGKCHLSEGHCVEAYDSLKRSLELLASEVKDIPLQIEVLESVAYLSAKTGQHELAAWLLAQSARQRRLYSYPETPQDSEYRKYIDPMIESWGQDKFDESYSDPGFGSFQNAIHRIIGAERLELVMS